MGKKGIMQAIRLEEGMGLAAYSTEQLQEELERRKMKNDSAIWRRFFKQAPKILAVAAGVIIVLLALVVVVCTGYAL